MKKTLTFILARGHVVGAFVPGKAAREGIELLVGQLDAVLCRERHELFGHAIGHCDTGDAVITPGFALKARHVIHVVGPRWHGGERGEEELLASCYARAIELAVENGCESIAFPLISSGIFGYPKEEAWRVALGACREKLEQLGKRAPEVVFCVISDSSRDLGERVLSEMCVAESSSSKSSE